MRMSYSRSSMILVIVIMFDFSWCVVVTSCEIQGLGLLLEKAMATHSSTLAWKIPWTEEPGRLQSMGSLRVGHD